MRAMKRKKGHGNTPPSKGFLVRLNTISNPFKPLFRSRSIPSASPSFKDSSGGNLTQKVEDVRPDAVAGDGSIKETRLAAMISFHRG